jgi:formate dehydrogenase major subunit
MGVRTWIEGWPACRQFSGTDPLGRGAAVKSAVSSRLTSRTATADKVVKSVCPYCAVGCGQDVYVTDGKVVQIEGDPDSPVSRGRLCPKGSATLQLTTGDAREQEALHGARGDPDREPGPHLTLRYLSRSGDQLRARRRHHAAGSAELRLHRD